MDKEMFLRASFLEQRSNELQENLDFIDNQISELEEFMKGIEFIDQNPIKEGFSSLGRGVHIRTLFPEKELFVEVGSGIVLKKTPSEAVAIISSQIKRLLDARLQVLSEIDSSRSELEQIFLKLQRQAKDNKA